MIQLGANSVLFGGHSLEDAFRVLKQSGYDGIEISAIPGMSQHFVISDWRNYATTLKQCVVKYALPILAMEQPNSALDVMELSFQAAVECGIPIINVGPGGKSDDPGSLESRIEHFAALAKRAEHYGVTVCVKAHVGAAIYNTPTTLRLLESVQSPYFGLDMDPSHIYRAGEDPVEALRSVIQRVRHVHIRDCPGREPNPGTPSQQTNGRGAINLSGYIAVLHEHGYQGPVDLEIIGSQTHSLEDCTIIAAEARGHMQACLQFCGSR